MHWSLRDAQVTRLCSFIMDDTQTPRDEGFSPGCSSDHQKRSDPESSCVSMGSDASLLHQMDFMKSDGSIGHPQNLSSVHQKKSEPEPSCVSMRSDASLPRPVNFKSDDTRSILAPRSVTKPVCKSMNQQQVITYPGVSHEVLNTFRSNLKKLFECLYEGTAMQGNPTLLNEIYTELYITESENGEISNEHE
ncbi:hypothetical protein QQF64_006450, partial [Cirrhinus molitorella]